MKLLLSFPAALFGWVGGVFVYGMILLALGDDGEGGIHIGAFVLGVIGSVLAVFLVYRYGPSDDPPET